MYRKFLDGTLYNTTKHYSNVKFFLLLRLFMKPFDNGENVTNPSSSGINVGQNKFSLLSIKINVEDIIKF